MSKNEPVEVLDPVEEQRKADIEKYGMDFNLPPETLSEDGRFVRAFIPKARAKMERDMHGYRPVEDGDAPGGHIVSGDAVLMEIPIEKYKELDARRRAPFRRMSSRVERGISPVGLQHEHASFVFRRKQAKTKSEAERG